MRFSASSRARRANHDRITSSSWLRNATIGRFITIRLRARHPGYSFREAQLFVGAGVGCHLEVDGSPIPDGRTLASDLATEFKIDVGGVTDLAKISQIVELRKGRTELETFIRKRICNPAPDDTFCWISTVRWRAIFTTNYDNGIEEAYAQTSHPPQTPVPIAATSQLTSFDRRFQVPLYYLHGRLCPPEKPRIIITESDYAEFRKQRQMMFEVLKLEFATSAFLYIGYSNQDPNWKMLLEELRAEFYPAQLPSSYRVSPGIDPIDDEILKSKNVETIQPPSRNFRNGPRWLWLAREYQ